MCIRDRNDLVPDAGNYVNQTNIKVNCLMALTGQLTSPDIKMSLELPNERDEVQALVRNYIPTDEQMNMQILYLLGIGKFYTCLLYTSKQEVLYDHRCRETVSGRIDRGMGALSDGCG